MWLWLVITLTSFDDLLKIRGIQKQKEKRLTRSLPLLGTRTANRLSHISKGSVAASSASVKRKLAWSLEVFMVATIFQHGHKSSRVPQLPHQQRAKDHRQHVKEMLPNRIVGYSPDLARIVGGATIGLFLSQLLYLSDKGHNPEGWVYKSEAEMGQETGLTKREQQTARRKLLALGVIAIMRGGWKNTYHFKVIWEKLYQVIAGIQRPQNVPTEKSESEQNVSTEPVQNVPTQPPECSQTVPTERAQNVATHNRDNHTEDKEVENTSRENQTIWNKTREKLQEAQALEEVEARLNGTTLIEVTDTAAWIGVPNRYAIPWLERRMYVQISKALKGIVGKDLDLQFIAAS
jgi:hypothetical protein